MRKFRYIGDVENYEMFGYKFPIGKAVSINDDDTHALSKLPNNTCFKEIIPRSKPAVGDSNGDSSAD
ncbi:MAG: hypothetical protein V3T88_04765 [Nitrosomonadaceae bacterium]